MPNIIKNTSALLAAHLVSSAIAFGLLIVLPRYFLREDIGAYLWAAAFTSMMSVFIRFGMRSPLIREIAIAPGKAQSYISSALIIRMFLSVIVFAAMAGIVKLLGSPAQTVRMVYIIGLSEILNAITQLFLCVFRANEEMKFEALAVITERAFVFLVGVGLVIKGCELLTFCKIILVAGGVNLCLSFGIMIRRFTNVSFKLKPHVIKELLAQALPFALGDIFNIVYFRIAGVMLAGLSSHRESAVAWYELAYGVTLRTILIPGAFMGAVYPVMSRALGKQRSSSSKAPQSDFQRLYTHSLKLMFILALPISLEISLLSKDIASFWPGEYQPMSAALSFLCWAGGLTFMNTVLQTVLRAADKRAFFTTLTGTRLVFNVLLNLFLMPRWHHKGAAIAMVLTEIYQFIVGFRYISKKLAKPYRLNFIPKSVLASLGIGVLLFLLRGKIPLFLLIPITGLAYVGIMVLWKELSWSDITKSR